MASELSRAKATSTNLTRFGSRPQQTAAAVARLTSRRSQVRALHRPWPEAPSRRGLRSRARPGCMARSACGSVVEAPARIKRRSVGPRTRCVSPRSPSGPRSPSAISGGPIRHPATARRGERASISATTAKRSFSELTRAERAALAAPAILEKFHLDVGSAGRRSARTKRPSRTGTYRSRPRSAGKHGPRRSPPTAKSSIDPVAREEQAIERTLAELTADHDRPERARRTASRPLECAELRGRGQPVAHPYVTGVVRRRADRGRSAAWPYVDRACAWL